MTQNTFILVGPGGTYVGSFGPAIELALEAMRALGPGSSVLRDDGAIMGICPRPGERIGRAQGHNARLLGYRLNSDGMSAWLRLMRKSKERRVRA